MTAFDIVKASVDIVDAAEDYGLRVNRHKKALCPFHDDHNPSLSFKGDRFTCFACGASGDVIDLVGRLGNLLPFEAIRELNQTYRLNIDIDKPVASPKVHDGIRCRQQKKALDKWESQAFITLNVYLSRLDEWRAEYAPRHPDEALHPLFVEALTKQDYIEYILQTMFGEGDLSYKMAYYNTYRDMIEEINKRMEKERTANVKGAGTGDNPSGIVFPFECAALYAKKVA